MEFSDQELEDAAFGCRSLASIHRRDADMQGAGTQAELFARKVERLEALAARFQAELDRRRGVR